MKITRRDLLKEMREITSNNIYSCSENYLMTRPRAGQEEEFFAESEKLALIEQMIDELPIKNWRDSTEYEYTRRYVGEITNIGCDRGGATGWIEMEISDTSDGDVGSAATLKVGISGQINHYFNGGQYNHERNDRRHSKTSGEIVVDVNPNNIVTAVKWREREPRQERTEQGQERTAQGQEQQANGEVAEQEQNLENVVYPIAADKEHLGEPKREKMTYAGAIEFIMPFVREGSEIPFIIHRKQEYNGVSDEWTVEIPESPFLYLDEVRRYDPYASVQTGADFSGSSYPYVFDKVFLSRLIVECASAPDSADHDELHALVDFMEEHITEFSPEAANWLAELPKPLERLYAETPYFNGGIDGEISQETAKKAIEIIEGVAKVEIAKERENAAENTSEVAAKRPETTAHTKQTFAEAVEFVMPLIREGSGTSFIIHREQVNQYGTSDKWTVDFPDNAYLYLKEVREYDPYANVHTSKQFGGDNLSFASGKILMQRIVEECISEPDTADHDAFHIVINFMEEHLGDLSPQAFKWLTEQEKPLERVTEELKDTCTLIGGTIERPQRAVEVIETLSLGDYAKQNAEKPKTYANLQKECAAAIDEVIRNIRTYGDMAGISYVNCETAYEILCARFGRQCTNEVMAAIVARTTNDTRYDWHNREWAGKLDPERVEQAKNNIRYQTVNTHPTILNDIATEARKNTEKAAALSENLKKTGDKAGADSKDSSGKAANTPKTTRPRKPKKRDDDAR